MIIETMGRRRTTSYTKALLHFDTAFSSTAIGGTITDEVVGTWSRQERSAQDYIDTGLSKFGVGSIHGSLSTSGYQVYVKYDNAITDLMGGDFTVDCQVYYGSSDYQGALWEASSTGAGGYWVDPCIQIYQQAGLIKINSYDAAGTLTTINSAINLTVSAFNHVALVRSGATGYLFINGVNAGTISLANIRASVAYRIMYIYSSGSLRTLGMDEFRISDIARWTSNFTPPTSAYTLD